MLEQCSFDFHFNPNALIMSNPQHSQFLKKRTVLSILAHYRYDGIRSALRQSCTSPLSILYIRFKSYYILSVFSIIYVYIRPCVF